MPNSGTIVTNGLHVAVRNQLRKPSLTHSQPKCQLKCLTRNPFRSSGLQPSSGSNPNEFPLRHDLSRNWANYVFRLSLSAASGLY
jgi:hypothetical protein